MAGDNFLEIAKLKSSKFSQSIYDHTASQDLIDSILENGVLVPIWVDKEWVIISGHRRVDACKYLEIEKIESEIKEYSEDL